MIGRSFQGRVALFFAVLLVIVLGATIAAVYLTVRNSVHENIHEELHVGSRVFNRLLQTRNAQLLESVSVLTNDFGFKEAVATGDMPTINSALHNQRARIGADVAILVSVHGVVKSSPSIPALVDQRFPLPTLMKRANRDGKAAMLAVLGGNAYQLVLVPVNAPEQIAWACLGFRVNNGLTSDFKAITGLDVSIAVKSDAESSVLASTLTPALRENLRNHLSAAMPSLAKVADIATNDGDYVTLPLQIADADSTAIVALFQTPLTKALSAFRRLRAKLAILALAALTAALFGAVLLARGVTSPVRMLATVARRIGNGDYDRHVPVPAVDELAELAEAFNSMQCGIAEREAHILFQANHDPLTGLPNRRLARDRLEQAIIRGRRANRSGALLLLDLDRFKEINDTLGHATGDHVLKDVATNLSGCVRESDTVARTGGDEFQIILEGIDADRAQTVAENLREILEPYVCPEQLRVSVGVSIGIVVFPEHGSDVETLIRRADIAMYDAKQHPTRIINYQPGRDEQHLHRLKLMQDFRNAVHNDELTLYFQPQVAIDARYQISHVEALVRWRHPIHGVLPPTEFIPLAEQTGDIGMLTRWVIEQALRQCRAWQRSGADISVSVNLSAIDLLDRSLPGFIENCLRSESISPHKLVLEITESAVMKDAAYAIAMLGKLKELGIRIAIDDFGTGYSSLAQLKRLPVDELKIDKSFVMSLAEGTEDAVIVKSTIELAHNMGLEVVAEGVESETCWELLRNYRCNLAQGFLLSPPVPADQFDQWRQLYLASARGRTDTEHPPLSFNPALGASGV